MIHQHGKTVNKKANAKGKIFGTLLGRMQKLRLCRGDCRSKAARNLEQPQSECLKKQLPSSTGQKTVKASYSCTNLLSGESTTAPVLTRTRRQILQMHSEINCQEYLKQAALHA